MTRVVIFVDRLGGKSLQSAGVYGDHHVTNKVYILEDKDVFEKGVMMQAYFIWTIRWVEELLFLNY